MRDDPAESEVDSFINSEDIIDVDNEGLGSLEQTFEQKLDQDEPAEQINGPDNLDFSVVESIAAMYK